MIKLTYQEKIDHLFDMIYNLLEKSDDNTISWKIRVTWLKTVADMCNEAAELIEKENLQSVLT